MSNASGTESPSIFIVLPSVWLASARSWLSSLYGIGDLEPAATAWIDQLSDAGQSWWQAL
jgi:hypothetical protein